MTNIPHFDFMRLTLDEVRYFTFEIPMEIYCYACYQIETFSSGYLQYTGVEILDNVLTNAFIALDPLRCGNCGNKINKVFVPFDVAWELGDDNE